MLLGEPYGTPIPRQRCCCRSYAGCTASYPPTPRRYGLLPNMSESSGSPGANSVRGSPCSSVRWDYWPLLRQVWKRPPKSFVQMDAAKRAKSSGGKHEKAEYAWHDHWRYAFMRGSCFDAFVTDEGVAAVSRHRRSQNRSPPHAIQCRGCQPQNEPARILRWVRRLLRLPSSVLRLRRPPSLYYAYGYHRPYMLMAIIHINYC